MTSLTDARPLRADARRNREKVLVAARELFAERGAACSLDDVARAAGVGPGTLYRHFPSRDDLLQAVMAEWVDDVVADGREIAASGADAATMLTAWFERLLEHVAVYKGASAAMMTAMNDPANPMYGSCRAMNDANRVVVEHAAAEGGLRDGVDPDEVSKLVTGVAGVVDQAGLTLEQAAPMLAIIRDGILRPGA